MKLGSVPRYRQVGDMQSVIKGEYYLVVFVNRLDVFEAIEDAGDA